MMNESLFSTPYSKMWIDDSGIAHSYYIKKIDVTLEIAKNDMEIISKLSQGKKVPILVDLGNANSITRKAREFFSGNESKDTLSAAALITNSPMHIVMGNFFLGINKPPYPIKLFSSKENALEWLRKFSDKNIKSINKQTISDHCQSRAV